MADKLVISDALPIAGKRMCLIGNRGHHNFGDELILIGLMRLLFQSYQLPATSYQLFVSGGDLNFLRKFHKYFFSVQELKAVNYIQEIPHGMRSGLRFLTSHISHLVSYFSCDTFILGGGELFTQETPGSYLYRFRSLLPYRLRKIFFRNTKLYLMGGMQAPTKWYNKVILKCIVRRANGCFMRDEESVRVATMSRCYDATMKKEKTPQHRSTAAPQHILWFIDTSYFAVNAPKPQSIEASKYRNTEAKKRHIIINTNPLSGKWIEELSDIVRQYHKNGYIIYFLPAFFTANKDQDDMLCFKILKSQFDYIEFLDRRERDEFQIIFQSAEKIFCSRLHVFLIAAFWGLDVQAYAYQKKITKNKAILQSLEILKE